MVALDLVGCAASAAVAALDSLLTNTQLRRLTVQRCVRTMDDLRAISESVYVTAQARRTPLLVDLRHNGLEREAAASLFRGILPPGCEWMLLLTDDECVHAPPLRALV